MGKGFSSVSLHAASEVEFSIRPIKLTDVPLLLELFDTLSPTSVYFRFLNPLKSLSEEMLC